jgi:two-component system chemotaxis sensor kinase CheA
MNDELEEFKIEIMETLDRAEKALLEFDQLPDNQCSNTLYDEVFRSYHNIKGAAGMMEWEELQHHVHQLENVLMQSKQTASIPKYLIGWFLKGNDVARAIVNGIPHQFDYNLTSLTPEDPSIHSEEMIMSNDTKYVPIIAAQEAKTSSNETLPEEFFAEVKEGLERISTALIKMEADMGDKNILDALYRDIHSIKGAVQLFGLEEASILAHAMETSLEGVRGLPHFEVDKAHISTLLLCVDLMNTCVHNSKNDDTLKEVSFMANLLAPFNKTVNTSERRTLIETLHEEAIEDKNEVKAPIAAVKSVTFQSADGEKADSTIRVQVSLLDRLMTLMGEMVLVRNQVLQYSNKNDDLEFLNLSQKLDVVTSELQEETMKTRMQPIGNVLTKFQRVVRDLSGSLNKKINLNLQGVETELDKTLIEAVKDPLTHIVRNACDHGIENPETRIMSGKSETGTITIRAYHEGGQVIVDISDDGKGLSREKLLKKAMEKGIIDVTRAERMSDREVQNLIFAPGFSTAEKVTNVSGRGVGMDVVKSNIEKIGGLVDISSIEGEGTKITLKIPLTLAIVPAMIIRSDDDRFAIPQVKLVELVRVEKTSIEYVQGRPIYRLRGNLLPLINLREVFGNTEKEINPEEAINIVVLNSETHLFGMIVDEILDTADIVVKPLARFLKSITIYSGATVLGDGSVAFILDVHGIAQKHLGAGSDDESRISDKYAELVNNELELREFVLVSLGSKAKHAIPLSVVSRMEEIKTSTIEISGHQRVIRYRGGVLRIVNLNDVLGYPKTTSDHEITQVIVAKIDDQLFGLEVDQIIDVLSTRDHLDDALSTHEAITGNLVTKDEIIVVIDVDKVFEMTLPKRHQSSGLGSISRLGAKILLVEDTESIRNKIQHSLSEDGFDVEVAIDGIEGLRKIAEHKCSFDLIISDIEMPKMNGYEFVKKVRSIGPMKTTPIIAFTTKTTSGDIQQAKTAGFTTFLEKSKGKLLPLLINECLSNTKRKSA